MGTNTPYAGLYKPAGGELVDVVAHVNQNLDKIDNKLLNQDSRIGVAEALAGVAPWKTFTPTIRANGGAFLTLGATTIRKGLCFKLGDLIYVEIHIGGPAGCISDGSPGVGSDPLMLVTMPYGVKNDTVSAAANGLKACIAQSATEYWYGNSVYNSTTEYLCLKPIAGIVSIDWDATTTIAVAGWYRTDGTTNLVLTNE